MLVVSAFWANAHHEVRRTEEPEPEPKNRRTEEPTIVENLEVTGGFEPPYTALQAAA